MKWAEVITVRSTGSSAKTLVSALQELMSDVDRKHGSKRIRVYHRERVESDFCVILSQEGESVRVEGSRLGVRLLDAMKAFGLVNHSVWIALDSAVSFSGNLRDRGVDIDTPGQGRHKHKYRG